MKGLGCSLGLETGAPSRLTPLQATLGGDSGPTRCCSGGGGGGVGSDEAYQRV